MMCILYYKLLYYYMDTITILGISLLFFYSLTTILQFYGVDTSVYAIYILFYVFLIISRLILPTTYIKLFPSDSDSVPSSDSVPAPTTPADLTAVSSYERSKHPVAFANVSCPCAPASDL